MNAHPTQSGIHAETHDVPNAQAVNAPDVFDVLIAGAGISGLAAARTLADAGLRVLLLEAQNRVGGRIFTERIHTERGSERGYTERGYTESSGDAVIELGAEFVHGRPPELLALIEEAGLALIERGGSFLTLEDGELASEEEDSGDGDFFAPLDRLEDFDGPDLTFAGYLDRANLPASQRVPLIGYVEGFNAADHRVISTASLGVQQRAEADLEGDRSFFLPGGYDQLPQFLARRFEQAGGTLRADTRVYRIDWHPNQDSNQNSNQDWRPSHVEAHTNQGSFHARQAVITLPLGVLQNDRVAFHPEPGEILTFARQIAMGQVSRITLHFRERFWQDLPPRAALAELSFLFTPEQIPSVWWTQHPHPSTLLTGWVGGPRSAPLLELSAEELGSRACHTLAKVFGLNSAFVRTQLLGCSTHNWHSDANTLGAYSYIAAGGLDAPRRMTEPVADTLYFAGEHTDLTGNWGTVHAALGSGLRAARQILQSRAPRSDIAEIP
jgi:monoamine oxidase